MEKGWESDSNTSIVCSALTTFFCLLVCRATRHFTPIGPTCLCQTDASPYSLLACEPMPDASRHSFHFELVCCSMKCHARKISAEHSVCHNAGSVGDKRLVVINMIFFVAALPANPSRVGWIAAEA